MPTIWSVDRIEGELAMCEGPGRTMREIPLSLLPAGLREGDCLREEDGVFTPDPDEAERRRAANRALFRRLSGGE